MQNIRYGNPMPAKSRIAGRFILATAISFLALGCGSAQLSSQARDVDVAIDGRLTEWGGKLEYIEKANMSIGLVNDDLYLYAAVVIRDRQVSRQLMMTGFTLWLNDRANKDQRLGIQFPNRTANLGPMAMTGERSRQSGRQETAAPDSTMIEEFIRTSVEEMKIMSPQDWKYHQLHPSNVNGVEAMTGFEKGILVYEFKLPLMAGQMTPVAISTEKQEVIGVGLVSPEIERPKMSGQGGRGGGMSGGGRPPGGRGGGVGGRGPGGMGGNRLEMPEPLDLWAVVRLADANLPAR